MIGDPVHFILLTDRWQAGYDRAILHDGPIEDVANPFDMDDYAFYGFEAGLDDARKLKETAKQ